MACDQPGPFKGTKCWKDKGHDGDHADAGFGYHLSFDDRFGIEVERCHFFKGCDKPAICPAPGEATVVCAEHMGRHDANNCKGCGTFTPEGGGKR